MSRQCAPPSRVVSSFSELRTHPVSGLKKCIAVMGCDLAVIAGFEGGGRPAQFKPTTSATISASIVPPNTGVGFLRVVATSRGITPLPLCTMRRCSSGRFASRKESHDSARARAVRIDYIIGKRHANIGRAARKDMTNEDATAPHFGNHRTLFDRAGRLGGGGWRRLAPGAGHLSGDGHIGECEPGWSVDDCLLSPEGLFPATQRLRRRQYRPRPAHVQAPR